MLKTEADVVVVVGTPLDFRLSFGRFGDAQVVHVVDSPTATRRARRRRPRRRAGDLTAILDAHWPTGRGTGATTSRGSPQLRDAESAPRRREQQRSRPTATRSSRRASTASCASALDRDAIVVCDGGDFVSYAGKYVDSYEPGCWLDPGPYGCLGTGMGYAMAARVAHPDRQVVVMLGDGAAGFSLMDVDSLVRHGLPVVIVVGNNGIWGLEKHPMQAIYGYDVAAELRPGRRYDQVVEGARRRRRARHATRTTSAPRSTARSRRACPTWSTSSPTPPTSTRAPRTSADHCRRRSGWVSWALSRKRSMSTIDRG